MVVILITDERRTSCDCSEDVHYISKKHKGSVLVPQGISLIRSKSNDEHAEKTKSKDPEAYCTKPWLQRRCASKDATGILNGKIIKCQTSYEDNTSGKRSTHPCSTSKNPIDIKNRKLLFNSNENDNAAGVCDKNNNNNNNNGSESSNKTHYVTRVHFYDLDTANLDLHPNELHSQQGSDVAKEEREGKAVAKRVVTFNGCKQNTPKLDPTKGSEKFKKQACGKLSRNIVVLDSYANDSKATMRLRTIPLCTTGRLDGSLVSERLKQPKKYQPKDRNDALTNRPIDFENEDETRKGETIKWLDSHFGSVPNLNEGSYIRKENVDYETQDSVYFNIIFRSISSRPANDESIVVKPTTKVINCDPNPEDNVLYCTVKRKTNHIAKGFSNGKETTKDDKGFLAQKVPAPILPERREYTRSTGVYGHCERRGQANKEQYNRTHPKVLKISTMPQPKRAPQSNGRKEGGKRKTRKFFVFKKLPIIKVPRLIRRSLSKIFAKIKITSADKKLHKSQKKGKQQKEVFVLPTEQLHTYQQYNEIDSLSSIEKAEHSNKTNTKNRSQFHHSKGEMNNSKTGNAREEIHTRLQTKSQAKNSSVQGNRLNKNKIEQTTNMKDTLPNRTMSINKVNEGIPSWHSDKKHLKFAEGPLKPKRGLSHYHTPRLFNHPEAPVYSYPCITYESDYNIGKVKSSDHKEKFKISQDHITVPLTSPAIVSQINRKNREIQS